MGSDGPPKIPHREFGATGTKVSVVGMGCSPFGHAYGVSDRNAKRSCTAIFNEVCIAWQLPDHVAAVPQTPDEDAALKAIQLAFDNGVNFFDVAPFYAAGNAEQVQSRCEHAAAALLRQLIRLFQAVLQFQVIL